MWGSVVGVGHRPLSLLSAPVVRGPRVGGAHTLTHTRTRTLMHTLYGLAGLSSVVAARPSFLGRSLLIYVTCDRRAFLPRAGDY